VAYNLLTLRKAAENGELEALIEQQVQFGRRDDFVQKQQALQPIKSISFSNFYNKKYMIMY